MLRVLPKWLYVVLAVASYLGLRQISTMLAPSEGIVHIFFMAAYWGQYLLPVLLLIAAVFLGRGDGERAKSGGRVRRDSAGSTLKAEHHSVIKIDPFRKMSSEEFHRLLAEFFIGNGFTVEQAPPGLGDGVDLMLGKNSKTFVAQYRHWRELRVGVPMVREQYTVMQAARADGVYVITTGEFSYKAIQFAEDKNISLIDGIKLRRLIKKTVREEERSEAIERTPTCPLCAAEMQIRTVTDAEGKDRRFWRCSNYPKCTGTVDRVHV